MAHTTDILPGDRVVGPRGEGVVLYALPTARDSHQPALLVVWGEETDPTLVQQAWRLQVYPRPTAEAVQALDRVYRQLAQGRSFDQIAEALVCAIAERRHQPQAGRDATRLVAGPVATPVL